MADNSAIEWTDATWNPMTGCTPITRGCDHCYAERLVERFRGVAGSGFTTGFDVTLRPERLSQPLRWQRPRRIFVTSMGDLFHREVPDAFVDAVLDVIDAAPRHSFQLLTKRSPRMRDHLCRRYPGGLPAQLWAGVSVEDAAGAARIRHLQAVPEGLCFLSIEPLLGPLDALDLTGIGWVIVGGESGPGARPMAPEWVRSIRDRCVEAGVAFFFKQWGGVRAKAGGRLLDGVEWSQMPA